MRLQVTWRCFLKVWWHSNRRGRVSFINFYSTNVGNEVVHAGLVQLNLGNDGTACDWILLFRFSFALGMVGQHLVLQILSQMFVFDFFFCLAKIIPASRGKPSLSSQGTSGDLLAMLFHRFSSNVAWQGSALQTFGNYTSFG